MKRYIWMLVTMDRLRLPIALFDRAEDLARHCGVSVNAIYSGVSHAKERGHRSKYVKVEIEEEDDDLYA